ncbi:MAG: hypothetical protein JXX28_14690 [Deltaproteobacteria bacterium]|nr:hypothetical protein [Deltaproteobacteria bacterium]
MITLLTTGLWIGQGSAWTVDPSHFTVAIFGDAAVGLTEQLDLSSSSPLFGLAAPHLELKRTVWERERAAVAVSGSLGVPTLGLGLLQGTLIPSEAEIPWTLTEGLALTGSIKVAEAVLSATVEGRSALPSGTAEMRPLDLPFWDPMMAPLVEGPTASLRLWADYSPTDRLMLTAVGTVQVGGLGPDLDGRLVLSAGLTPHLQARVGVAGAAEGFVYGRGAHAGPVLDARWTW